MIKTTFKTRLIISIMLLVMGTGYVVTPKEFQPYLLIPYTVFFIAYVLVYLRYGVRTFNLISKKKTSTSTPFSDFNSDIEQIFQSFSNILENKTRIVFSTVVDNFEASPIQKIIYVNPNYVNKSDKQDIEASLYHELGHVKEFWRHFLDGILFNFIIPLFYWMIFPVISMMRGDVPIIPIISVFVLFRLMMIVISWRNEYRADTFASKHVSLESLEKMLESISVKYSVETHPSPSKRLTSVSKKY